MENIIKVHVGEIVVKTDDVNNFVGLVYQLERDGICRVLYLNNPPVSERTTLDKLYSLIKVGEANGIGNFLEGEDWICHDKRCYPGVLADSCSDCQYSKLIREKKRYYEPGDRVWVPSENSIGRVSETILYYSRYKTGPYFPVSSGVYSYLLETDPTNLFYSVRFRVFQNIYRYNELCLVRRKKHLINFPQLEYICNEACLFGPHDVNNSSCSNCETNKIWKSYDIRRDCT